jgi:hypothetical protein
VEGSLVVSASKAWPGFSIAAYPFFQTNKPRCTFSVEKRGIALVAAPATC